SQYIAGITCRPLKKKARNIFVLPALIRRGRWPQGWFLRCGSKARRMPLAGSWRASMDTLQRKRCPTIDLRTFNVNAERLPARGSKRIRANQRDGSHDLAGGSVLHSSGVG